jgi:hypothetical protein
MKKHKLRAVAVLVVLGSILGLLATWDDPGDGSEEARAPSTGA